MRLWRRLGKSVMLKIWSTAVTHRAASHRPYWLIWACVCCGGGTSSYIGTSDIDTVNLWLSDLTWHFLFSFLFFPTFLSMSTEYRYIVFSAWEPAVSLSLLLHSLSVLKAALSPPKHPIAPSPPSLLCLPPISLDYFFFHSVSHCCCISYFHLTMSLPITPCFTLMASPQTIFSWYRLRALVSGYVHLMQRHDEGFFMQHTTREAIKMCCVLWRKL